MDDQKQELIDWLRFLSLEFSASKAKSLLDQFGTPGAILAASRGRLREQAGLRPADIEAIRNAAQWEPTSLPYFEKGKMRLIKLHAPDYPASLQALEDPPVALFVRGNFRESDRFGVAIVGTRRASPYGRMVAERLSHDLAQAGLTIISGGAAGIDTIAHQATLAAGGRTIAVLGSGLDVPYPPSNHALFERIASQGVLVSEFPPGSPPDSWRFPVRNRLIAALALAVVVVEAPEESGALITARIAAEIGREVFVVPGNVDNPNMVGSHRLIKDGATLIESAQDVLEALGVQSAPKPSRELPLLSATQEKLLNILSLQPKHLDMLAREAQLPIHQVQIEVTTLELLGLARRMPGGAFVRVL